MLKLVAVVAVLVLITVFVVSTNGKKTEKNNSESDKSRKLTLYKAEWCPACKAFLPVWDSIKEKLVQFKIETETVECTKTPERCAYVKYLPALVLSSGGSDKEYPIEKPRSVDAVVEFVKSGS